MVTIHRENFVCLKADGYLHPDYETPRQLLTRHYWALTSMLAARAKMAGYCPTVAAGRARERLVIREAEFTVKHRPMALRVLLAECFTCPDPEPLEPIVNPDPTVAEVVAAAAADTLGRLRYHAQSDGQVAAILAQHDAAVAAALGIEPTAVPALTATTPVLTEEQRVFERLLEASTVPPRRPDAEPADRYAARNAVIRVMREMDAAHRDEGVLLDAALGAVRAMPHTIRSQVRPMLADLVRLLETKGLCGPAARGTNPDAPGQRG